MSVIFFEVGHLEDLGISG